MFDFFDTNLDHSSYSKNYKNIMKLKSIIKYII
jgi:hypothetical protein